MATDQQQAEGMLHSSQAVGDAFVRQYYYVLRHSPELLHRFYQDTSIMGRPEGEGLLVSVTTMQAINDKIISLEYGKYEPEIMTVDAQDSTDGGVFVLVTGCITREDDTKINFTQSFFLATQENGYFVLNDIFRYTDFVNTQEGNQSSWESNQTFSYEQDIRENAPVEEDLPEKLVPQQEDEANIGEVYNPPDADEGSVVDVGVSFDHAVDEVADSLLDMAELTVNATATAIHDEAPKKSYASILKVRKENVVHLQASSSSILMNSYAKQEWKVSSPPAPSAPSAPAGNTSSSSSTTNNVEVHESGNGFSIYVKNLPMNATSARLEQEFKKFGPIKSNGIQVRSRKQEGFCFGFVEFETVDAAQSAIQASPVLIDGHEVYVMAKRSTGSRGNSRSRFTPRRGGYGSKGRGSYTRKSYGRSDFNNRGDYGNRMDGRGRSANHSDGGYQQVENNARTNRPRSSASNVSSREGVQWVAAS